MDTDATNVIDELAETKQALKLMSEEMIKMKTEMAEIRKEAGAGVHDTSGDFALGFMDKEFMSMSPTGSLRWVSGTLVPRLQSELRKYPSVMQGLDIIAGTKSPFIWTCSGYNRGESCHAKWHVHERTCKTNPSVQFRDLRLHFCTLCYDGLGILSDHPVTSCPWIKSKTWNGLIRE